ncbi:glucose-6-phosphate dehydrogenase [Nostoc sp. CHAB 5844]|nr:glucose-6-phosphate dehydrogenase [Nostoc sp. CHAB 5844]
MSAFSPSNLPSTVDTLEKLMVWCGAAFHKINRTATAVEGTGSPSRVAQFGIYTVEASNTDRVIMRQSLLLNSDYAIDNKPVWENVQETSTDAIPSEFLAS